jgi:Spy/CpxP family protein refolding chaperone
MSAMRKLFLIVALVLGTVTFIHAQENNTESRSARQQMDPSAIIDSRVEDLTTRLSLTSQQVAQVRAIYEKTLGTQMSSEENNEAANLSQSSSDQRHTEIMALLNADQKKIYETYLEERNQPRQVRQGEASTGRQMNSSTMIDRRVEDLTNRLSLTDTQIAQVRAIYEKTMEIEGGSEQRHTEIMELLNADQKTIYEAYLNEREQ